jgi:hypothetical protein
VTVKRPGSVCRVKSIPINDKSVRLTVN